MAQSSNDASGVVWVFRRPTQPSRFIYNIYRTVTYIDNKKQVSIKIKKKNTKTSRKLTGSLACGRMRGGGYLSLSRGVLKNKTTHTASSPGCHPSFGPCFPSLCPAGFVAVVVLCGRGKL